MKQRKNYESPTLQLITYEAEEGFCQSADWGGGPGGAGSPAAVNSLSSEYNEAFIF